MSLQPSSKQEIPSQTAEIAEAAFPNWKGTDPGGWGGGSD
jgi:hypothetical protein